METINDVLHYIQKNVVVPKGRTNKFGGYQYRSCEDIVDAIKKLLPEGACLCMNDTMVMLGNRFYVKATATLYFKGGHAEADGWARESETKKGFDESQITGAASSYARKYALNGLFAIDDSIDADAMDNTAPKPAPQKAAPKPQKQTTETPQEVYDRLVKAINGLKSMAELNKFLNQQSVKDAMDRLYLDNIDLSDKLADLVASKNEDLAAVI